MWIHGLLYLLLLLWLIGEKAGWIPPGCVKEKARRYSFWLLLAGNLLGTALTVSRNQALQLENGAYFERKAYGEGLYEEKLVVTAKDGREGELSLEIPEQEGEAETAEPAPAPPDFEEEIQAEISRFNEEKQDDKKYYLPDSYQGQPLTWKKARDHTGALLAILALITTVLLPGALEQEERRKEEKRREQMQMDYPGLVMKLTLFMEAGMSVRRAFQKAALDYKNKKPQGGTRYAYEELLQSAYEMDNGVSEGEAYLRFGRRCGEVRYKTLSTLLVQNLKKGNQGLVQMLEQESIQAWEDRKRKARVLGEEAATKLLIPMVLMLLVVLAILMIPACLSFYS